jgi:hypothetical protein
MTTIELGVTGTRQKPTWQQLEFLFEKMCNLHYDGCRTLHHGCCTGWDEAAHYLARALGWKVVVHPPTNRLYLAEGPLTDESYDVEVRPAKPYAERNQDIVNESAVLVGGPLCPKADAPRSGTWLTLDMTHRARKPWSAVFPDGGTHYGEW